MVCLAVVEQDVVEAEEWVEEWVKVEGRVRVEVWDKVGDRDKVKDRDEWEAIVPAPGLAVDVSARAVVRR